MKSIEEIDYEDLYAYLNNGRVLHITDFKKSIKSYIDARYIKSDKDSVNAVYDVLFEFGLAKLVRPTENSSSYGLFVEMNEISSFPDGKR